MKTKSGEQLVLQIRTVVSWLTFLVLFWFVYTNSDLFRTIFSRLSITAFLALALAWSVVVVLGFFSLASSINVESEEKLHSIYLDVAIKRVLSKYIPGGIWTYLGKGADLSNHGINASVIRELFVYETLMPAIVALGFSAPLVILFFDETLSSILASVAVVTLFGLVFGVYLKLFRKSRDVFNFKKGFLGLSLYWLLASLVFAMYFHLVSNQGMVDSFLAGALWVFSWVIGYAVLIVPQGLGISESSFSYFWSSEDASAIFVFVLGFRAIIFSGEIFAVICNSVFRAYKD